MNQCQSRGYVCGPSGFVETVASTVVELGHDPTGSIQRPTGMRFHFAALRWVDALQE